MNHIAHRNYVQGLLDCQVIPLIDWPSNRNWMIHKGELYSRRTSHLVSNDTGLSAIYYLGAVEIDEPGPQERTLPYYLCNRATDDTTDFSKLLKNVKHYVSQHHKSVIVIVELELEFPRCKVTQAFHATTSDNHIEEFLNFARTLQFDPDHDDAMRRPIKA